MTGPEHFEDEPPLQEWTRDRRAALCRGIAELFAQKGFHAVSMRMIAEKLGLNPGTLYYYFESKEHALREICEIGVKVTVLLVKRVLREHTALRPRLEALFFGHLQRLDEYSPFMTTVAHSRNYVPAPMAGTIQASFAEYRALLEQIFSDAACNGELRSDVQIKHARMAVNAFLRNLNQSHLTGEPDLQQYARAAVDILLRGVSSQVRSVDSESTAP